MSSGCTRQSQPRTAWGTRHNIQSPVANLAPSCRACRAYVWYTSVEPLRRDCVRRVSSPAFLFCGKCWRADCLSPPLEPFLPFEVLFLRCRSLRKTSSPLVNAAIMELMDDSVDCMTEPKQEHQRDRQTCANAQRRPRYFEEKNNTFGPAGDLVRLYDLRRGAPPDRGHRGLTLGTRLVWTGEQQTPGKADAACLVHGTPF